MTKTEFLEYLEKRIQVLNQKERDDILSEYAQHIEFKMESGLSEEDAIHDFGNLEELAAEILDAYNVNPDYNKKTLHIDGLKIGKGMTQAGHKVGGLFEKSTQVFKHLFKYNPGGKFAFFLKCCLILAVLLIVYFPLSGLDFLIAKGIYSMFGRPLDYLLSFAIVIGFHLVYLFLAVSVFYAYVSNHRQNCDLKKRTEKEEFEDRDQEEELQEERADAEGKKENRRLKKVSLWLKDLFTLPGYSKKEPVARVKHGRNLIKRIWDLIKTCVILMVKGFVICCLTPVLLCLLLLVIGFGILIVLVFLGYPLVGVTVMTFGGLVSGFAFIWFAGSFLFSKKAGTEE